MKKSKSKVKHSAPMFDIPEGYKITSTNFAAPWDYKKNNILEGEVVEIKEVKKGGKIKKDTRIMTVQNGSGEPVAVWESSALRVLFDQVEEGSEIFIKYRGERKVKGQKNPMHDFVAGIKD